MPEIPAWRRAWMSELIARVAAEPSLVASCPRPVAQCLAEICAPTGVMPDRPVQVLRDPQAPPAYPEPPPKAPQIHSEAP